LGFFAAHGNGAQRVEARGRRLHRDVVVLRLIRQRYGANHERISKLREFVISQTGLFENGSKRSCRNVAGMHGYVSLTAISVTQDNVRTGLSFDDEPGALQL
jgi:hypothetical protein